MSVGAEQRCCWRDGHRALHGSGSVSLLDRRVGAAGEVEEQRVVRVQHLRGRAGSLKMAQPALSRFSAAQSLLGPTKPRKMTCGAELFSPIRSDAACAGQPCTSAGSEDCFSRGR